MEWIQAVQTPDNRVPLIANKATVVRVYVKMDSPVDVTGRLTAHIAAGGTRDKAPLAVGGKSYVNVTSDRNKWESSLNFLLDADMTGWGTREIKVRIYSV